MQSSAEPMKNSKSSEPHYRQLRGESDFPHEDTLIEFKIFDKKNNQVVYGRNYFSEKFGRELIKQHSPNHKILYRIIK